MRTPPAFLRALNASPQVFSGWRYGCPCDIGGDLRQIIICGGGVDSRAGVRQRNNLNRIRRNGRCPVVRGNVTVVILLGDPCHSRRRYRRRWVVAAPMPCASVLAGTQDARTITRPSNGRSPYLR